MSGVIFQRSTRFGRRHYRRGEFAEVSAAAARALTNAGTAIYADGRKPDMAWQDSEGRSVRAFDLPFTPRGR